MKHITASGAQEVGNVNGIFIQVNAALTGTITITYAGETQYSTGSGTAAVITNPTVGSQYKYFGFKSLGAVSVNPSATCDITVSTLDQIS